MKWESRCPSFYPDQLIQDKWVLWSETVLNQAHDKMYSTPRGFQEFIHDPSSNTRTRAGELYTIGLLRGLLVSEREGVRGSIPYGWRLIQDDQHVHTRLGYLAYPVG